MTAHILFAYDMDAKGAGVARDKEQVNSHAKSKAAFTWIHLDGSHEDTAKWMRDEKNDLDPLVVEALLEESSRPRMLAVDDGLLVMLRGVNLNANAQPEDMVGVRIWLDKNRIITMRRRKVKAILDIEERIRKGEGPTSPTHFLSTLIHRLFERMEPVLGDLDDATDDIEEQVVENAGAGLRERIIDVRKKAILFRRYMMPQRDAIAQLTLCDIPWVKEERHSFQESYNHISRYVENLDAVRERAQIVKDEIANILSDNLNKNMYVLSLIAGIFLPLGFLTGLFGINIGGMPGVDDPSAFWWFSGSLTVLVLIQVIVFKKLKWL